MKPMLAFKFSDYGNQIQPPFYTQPKLNGVRALFHQGQWQSRDEKIWNESTLQHLTKELSRALPPTWLTDGELYVHGWSLQQINSAIAVKRGQPSPRTHLVEYHIFDTIDTQSPALSFEERLELMLDLEERLLYNRTDKTPHRVRIIPTTRHKNLGEAEFLYTYYRQSGYEGLMYRQADAPYGFLENCTNKENRWRCLLKRKDWLDDEFQIESFNLTEGKKGETGFQLWCRAKNGKLFSVGSGLSDEEVQFYAREPEQLWQCCAKIKYEILSDEGIPLKPTLETILDQ